MILLKNCIDSKVSRTSCFQIFLSVPEMQDTVFCFYSDAFSPSITSNFFLKSYHKIRQVFLKDSKFKTKTLAERGFDPRTSGLWAQHASTAPLCFTYYPQNAIYGSRQNYERFRKVQKQKIKSKILHQ